MGLISVIDLGTGSIRVTVYDLTGRVVEEKKKDNPVIYPRPGWAEQDPAFWWTAIGELFGDMEQSTRQDIIAISSTSQREGIVPVDRSFQPLGNMIIWLDGRTNQEGDEIVEKLGEQAIYDITGLVANPAWSLSKILWMRKNTPDNYQNAYKFLQAEDYVLSRLSGKAVTELSIASRTCLLDVVRRRWSRKILDDFDIHIDKLPELMEPGSLIGTITADVSHELGLPEAVKVYAGAGDQQAAALGVGALEEGMVSIGIGTSSALSMTLDNPVKPKHHKIILNCAALPGKWEYEPPIWNTGGLVKWFVEDVMEDDSAYERLLSGAALVPAGSEGLIAMPYFSGAGSPRWNPELKGGFYGLGLHHKQVHLLRALMESIAFEIKFNINSIRASGISLKKVILSGGASRNKPLCQIVADVLQSEVDVFVETEASSWGVFLLVKNEIQKDQSGDSDIHIPEYLSFYPDSSSEGIYEIIYQKYLRLGDHFEKLNL
jgi:sugar (pentulose or hexulose) kinase